MLQLLQDWLMNHGFSEFYAEISSKTIAFLLVILLSIIADKIAKSFILKWVSIFIAKTKSKWDDALHARNFFNQMAHLAPAVVIYLLTPIALAGTDRIINIISAAIFVYMIILIILIIDSFLNATHDIYNTFEASKEIPIKSFIQVVKLIVYMVGIIYAISLVINKSPLFFFSGLGAMTAVLMLIFKDAILGFVAGIQLSANKMVSHGDWIEMPKYGADGDVMEVGLTTVKVQNFDKTITTIPTYALISESFKNWRGMDESGGRRIKRSVYIDVHTIKLCTPEMLERFRKIQYISGYIDKTKEMIEEYNKKHEIDDTNFVNGRRMTNVGTFRAYVISYLKNHPMINPNMTFLVRQLPPSEIGLPIQIYVFCRDQVWANYEAIQADIFDHILAVVPEFDLQVFQNPTGGDFRSLTKTGMT